jgi:CheY-like chemotaxis protein/anti-sigma regulatory factor (Ser/Thr protein kinase)
MERILVVDDSAVAREVAGQCLRDHGMIPVFAENGRQAVRVVEENPPDAVLTDLRMPEMDGLKLVEYIRREHSGLPVVLMTSHGNEQTAVDALKAGALSYIPKKELRGNLCDAMGMVIAAVEARRFRERARALLERSEAHFVLGYELDGPSALVSHLQGNLEQLNFCDDTALFQVSTALAEAFNNAIDHGNLELDSALREESHERYDELRNERARQQPYCDRRVRVTERITPDAVTYVVLDAGNGFDVTAIPDPTDPQCLLKASGRGLMLVRTFMDEVTFNQAGNEITMAKRRSDGSS